MSTLTTKPLLFLLILIVYLSGCANIGKYKVDKIKHDLESSASTVSLSCPSPYDCRTIYSNQFIIEAFIEKAKHENLFCIVHYFDPYHYDEYSFFIAILMMLEAQGLLNRQVDFYGYQSDDLSWSFEKVLKRMSSLARYYSDHGAEINKAEFQSSYGLVLPKQCRWHPSLVLTSNHKMSLLSKQANYIAIPNREKLKHVDTIVSIHYNP